MAKPVGWTPSKPPPLPPLAQTAIPLPATNAPLSTTPSPLSTHPPQLQARLLTALTHHHPPEVYIPHLKAFDQPTNAAWPKFVAACLTPQPCPQLSTTKALLQGFNPDQCNEILPEPMRGLQYKSPAPGYKAKTPDVPQRRTSNVSTPAPLRKPSLGEVIRLGTNMQPSLSRRKSAVMKTTVPRVNRSMFLSGRKSERVRLAEEKEREEREERERAERERAEKEKEREANENGSGGRELLDLTDHDSDLDFTVRDAAEIERMEGMDDNMIRTQMDKEAKPRHVGAIVKKMHNTTAGTRNIVVTESDQPLLSDTGYARVLRREEAAKKRQEQAEAAKEKERLLAEQRKEKFNRKRRRKLRKAGKIIQEESEEEETSAVPQEEASQSNRSDHELLDCTSREARDGRGAQRPRLEAPLAKYGDHRPDDRYREYEHRQLYDDRHYPPLPHDPRRPPPPNWSPHHHYSHPPPPHYAPPSPYYAPPSPYYNYPPPPYYPHHPPPPPPSHSYYPTAPAPPRLGREEYEKRKRELYEQIGGMCSQLHTDDARAIDDFLDNQDHMFRPNERTRYIMLDQTRNEEVLLRIDRDTHRWEVVRKQIRGH